jgi:hypothetical protein
MLAQVGSPPICPFWQPQGWKMLPIALASLQPKSPGASQGYSDARSSQNEALQGGEGGGGGGGGME